MKHRTATILILFSVLQLLVPPSFARAESELTPAGRQERVNVGFQKGKSLYDAGRYEEAIVEWDALEPYLDEGSSVRRVVEFLKRRVPKSAQKTAAAKSAASATPKSAPTPALAPVSAPAPAASVQIVPPPAASEQPVSAAAPSELPRILDQAESKFAANEREASARAFQASAANEEAARRAARVEASLAKGKTLYLTGRVDEALGEWEKILPDVSDGPALREKIRTVRARKAAAETPRESASVPSAPAVSTAELSEFLTSAAKKMELQAVEMRARASSGAAAREEDVRRAERVRESLAKGKTLYLTGRVDEALAEWEKILPDVSDAAALREKIRTVRARKAAAAETRSATAASAAPAVSTDELSEFLSNAVRKLELEATEAASSRSAAEERARASERRAGEIEKAFAAGRAHYEAGRYSEAAAEWRRISTLPGVPADFSRTVQSFAASAQSLAAERARASVVPGVSSIDTADMSRFLETASRRIDADRAVAETRRAEARRPLEEKGRKIEDTFEQGKLLYYQGKYEEAIRVWETIAPELQEGDRVRALIDSLKKSHRTAIEAERAASALSSPETVKLAAPPELLKILDQADKKLKSELWEAQSRQTRALEEKKSREAELRASFEEGKRLFDAGRREEAFVLWDKLVARTEDARLSGRIKDLRLQSQNAALTANTPAPTPPPAVPVDEIAAYLDQAVRQLDAERASVEGRRRGLEKEASDRQTRIDVAFERGKALYQEGKYDEAIAEWAKVAAFASEGSDARARVAALKERHEAARRAKADAETAAARHESAPRIPAGFAASAEAAAEKLRAEAEAARRQKEDADRTVEDRRAALAAAFEKGRILFQEGRADEALAEWARLESTLDVDSRQKLDALRQARASASRAARAVEESVSRRAERLAPPADFAAALAQARQKTDEELTRATGEKERAQATIDERRRWVEDRSKKARALLESGDDAAALAEWSVIAPHLDADSAKKIESLAKAREEAVRAKKAAQGVASQSDRFRAPEGFDRLVLEARKRIEAGLSEARSSKSAAERSLAERGSWIETTFRQGRELAEGGRYDEAVKTWNALVPYLEDKTFERSLAEISEAQKRAQSARSAALEASRRAESRFAAPVDLVVSSQSATARLDTEAKAALEKKDKSERTLAERRTWIGETHAKGRAALAAGRVDDALAEWDKLVPYMDGGSDVRAALDSLKRAQSAALDAKKAAVEAAAGEYKSLGVPADAERAFADAEKRLAAERDAARSKIDASERTLAERRTWIDAAFRKGEDLLKADRSREAIEAWSEISPYLDENSDPKRRLDALKTRAAEADEAARAAQNARAKAGERFAAPPAAAKAFAAAEKRLADESALAENARREAEAARQERKVRLAAGFEKGRAFAEQGKFAEAAAEWEVVLPLVEEGSDLPRLLASVKSAHAAAVAAKRTATDAAARQNAKFKSPEGLSELLLSAERKLADEATTAQQKTLASQKSVSERQAWAAETFRKGKAFFDQGRYEEAVAEWEKAAPFVEESAGLDSLVADSKRTLAAARAARTEADTAQKRMSGKIAAPQGLQDSLSSAAQKLRTDAQSSEAERARLEKEIEARKTAAVATFKKGQAFYQAGQVDEAVKTWESLIPELGESELKPLIESVRESHRAAQTAKRSVSDFAAREYNELKVPYAAEISKALADAETKLKSDASQAQSKKSEMEKTLAERQAWIDATFQKGKALHAEGKLSEALELWNTITPYLENEPRMKEEIARVRQAIGSARSAQVEAERAEAATKMKFKTPDALVQTLDEAKQKLSTQAAQAQSSKAQAEKAVEERESWIRFTFQDGKNLYDAGKFAEAMELWKTLAPHVENGETLVARMDAVAKAHADAEREKRLAAEAVARQEAKFRTDEDLKGLLDVASKRLAADLGGAEARRGRAEKIVTERQLWIDQTFQKGKELLEVGRYHEAMKEWEAIVPYMDGEEEIKTKMREIADVHTEALLAQKAAEDASARETVKLEAPVELVRLLDETARGLKGEQTDAEIRRRQAEETLGERRAQIESAFQRGKTLFTNGQVREALKEWNGVLPQLASPEEVKGLLARVEKGIEAAENSKAVAAETVARQQSKLEVPAEILDTLRDAEATLKREAFEAQTRRTHAEETAAERQKKILESFEKGKALYDQGLYKEAVDEWESLLPYVDEQSGVRALVVSVRNSNADANEAKKAAVEAVANEYKGLKLNYSEQMAELLRAANVKLKAETTQASQKREDTETALAERKEWSVTTFNKGKILYEQGRMDEALEQWERLTPFLEGESEVRRLIETLKVNHNAHLNAQRGGEGAAGARRNEPAYLEEMSRFFDDAAKKLARDAENAKSRAAESEKTFAERKAWIRATFQKGKALYDQKRYAEAVKEWEILRPYLSEEPEIQKQIDAAKGAAAGAESARKEAAAVAAKKEALPALPPDTAEFFRTFKKPVVSSAETPGDAVTAKSGTAEAASQFVSGELTEVAEDGKTITMKLYTVGKQKSLVISLDNATKIDGAKTERTLQQGTAVDLRYDPKTNVALYIYVY